MILPEDTPGLKELIARNVAMMKKGEWPESGPVIPSMIDLDDPEALAKFEAALAELAKLAEKPEDAAGEKPSAKPETGE